MTFAELIDLLGAFDPEEKVFGVIGIGDSNQDQIIRYSSGHVLPGWDEWVESDNATNA